MNITARTWSEQGEGASDAEQGEAASDALEGVAKHLDGGVAKHLEGGVVATLRRVVEGSTGEDAVRDVVVRSSRASAVGFLHAASCESPSKPSVRQPVSRSEDPFLWERESQSLGSSSVSE